MDRVTALDKSTLLDEDVHMYSKAVKELSIQPVQGPSGMYHVKNGSVHYGYEYIPITDFSTSVHAWNIFH